MSFPGHQPPPGADRTDRLGLAELRQRVEAHSSWGEPILVITVGLALGLVDLGATEVPGMLRFPALIAALILVGHGLNEFDAARHPEGAEASERVPAGAGAGGGSGGSAPVNRGVDSDALEEETVNAGTTGRLVIVLSIWLGIATLLYPTAPLSLSLLSLLAAYLLFAHGWKLVLSARR